MPSFLFTPSPDKDAQRFLGGKAVVSRTVFDGLLPELRPYAFTVAGVENAQLLKKLRDRIAELPAGADWDELKADLAEEISPWLGGDAEAGRRRAETLLRTHGYQAFAVTHYRTLQQQLEVFPFWEYDTANDDRVRSTHAALDGKVFPANSPFWRSHFPPWEWGCRCNVIARSADDVAEIEAEDAKKIPEARRVIKGERLAKVEQEGTLLSETNGVPTVIDLRSPREKFGGSGFAFDPSALEIPLEDLKARYATHPEVWEAFETWARGQKLAKGRGTVWDWLEKKLPSATPADGWTDLAKVKDVRGLGGSTGARLVQAPGGARYVRKAGASAAHLREEFLADQLYRELGVAVPNSKLYETAAGPVKLAEFIEGRTMGEVLRGATAAERAKLLAEARQHFVADALLGNYDVAGLDLDNLLVDGTGKIWRIDNGGALRFRARGGSKTGFGAAVTELDTLRDAAVNPAAAQVFAGLGEADLREQLQAALARRANVLAATPADLRPLLSQRFDSLQARLEALEPKGGFTPEFGGQVAEARILGKAHLGDEGLVEDLQVLWYTERRAGADVTVARFKLTEAGGAAVKTAHPELARAVPPADKYWDRLLPIVRHVGHHASDGVYNPQKTALLDTIKAELAHEPADLRQYYLGQIDELTAAMAEKRPPKLLAQWQPPPPKTGKARGELSLAPSPWAFVAKSRRRGFAEARDTRLLEVKSAMGGKHGPTGAEIRAVLPDDASAPFALRGTVEIAVPGRGGPEAVRAVAAAAEELGVAIDPATGARRELTYLTRNLELMHKQLKPAQRTAWQRIGQDETLDPAERATRLRTWVRDQLGIDVSDGRTFAPDGAENTFGYGWRRWERWDLPRAEVEREMAGYTLHHHLSGSLPDVVASWLDGGGQVTPTVERLRVGVSISQGMSPSTDLDTGGASYMFTRIKTAAAARKAPGVTFKVGNLARLDAVSYEGDKFGDVRPAGANTHVNDPRTARGITPTEWKAFAGHSGNETLFKNGFHLLEDIDQIVTASAAERKQVIDIFATHGYSTLPDGRAVADAVIVKK